MAAALRRKGAAFGAAVQSEVNLMRGAAAELGLKSSISAPCGIDAGFRLDKRSKVSLLMQDLIDGQPSTCRKCAEWEDKFMADKRKFYFENEHFKRAINKLLDQCSSTMSPASFAQFKASLQLDVRFASEHEDVEDQEGRGRASAEYQNPELEIYKRKIKMLEEQLAENHMEKLELQEEVRESAANSKPRVKITNSGCQTENTLWNHCSGNEHEHGNEHASPTPNSGKIKNKDQDDGRAKKSRHIGGVSSYDDDGHEGVSKGQKYPSSVVGTSHVKSIDDNGDNRIDSEVHKRILNELELIKLKLGAAERENRESKNLNKNFEGKIAAMNKEMAELKEQIKAKESERSTAASKDAPEAPRGSTKASKEYTLKENNKVRRKRGASKPQADGVGSRIEHDTLPDEDQKASSDGDAASTADKCVGNGPGRGLADEPLRCRGRHKPTLTDVTQVSNTMGRCFTKQIRSVPHLRTTGDGVERSSIALPQSVQRTSCTDSMSTFSQMMSEQQSTTEPYLQQVWEQRPRSIQRSCKHELIRLGAFTPSIDSNHSYISAFPRPSSAGEGGFSAGGLNGIRMSTPLICGVRNNQVS